MNQYAIAYYPGDGIGPEVTNEARKVLAATQAKFNFLLDETVFPWSCEWSLSNDSKVVPNDYLKQLHGLTRCGNALIPDIAWKIRFS